MTNTVLILIGGHLSSAPRPLKEAMILSEAGYQVTVAGCRNSPVFTARDRELSSLASFSYVRYADISTSSPIYRLVIRAKRWLALRFGIFPGSYFGYAAEEMLRFALAKKADLTIVHSEAGLWVARQLATRNYRIGVDFEDWFSEQSGMKDNTTLQQRLKALELAVLSQSKYRLAASASMSQALSEKYGLTQPPAIAYNVFPPRHPKKVHEYIDRVDSTIPSLLWFSQTIGRGRGLELLMDSLYNIDQPVEIHLRGDDIIGVSKLLLEMAPSKHKPNIYFHPGISMDELENRIPEHDVGLALDLPISQNYDLTVTNKLFQYLSCGLHVIATRTRGQEEVARYHPNHITLLGDNTALELAGAIKTILNGKRWISSRPRAHEGLDEITGFEMLKKTLISEVIKAFA